MIIFGTRGITAIQQKGSFHCPACGAGALYNKKEVRRFFTLFFVPLIPLNKAADYIECLRCGGTFKPEVLSWNGMVPSAPSSATPPPLGPVAAAAVPPAIRPNPPGIQQVSTTTVSYQRNGLAKASMILGIVGLLSSFLICPSILLVIPSLIMGIIGLGRAKKSNGLMGGRGEAIAGITCSSLGLVVMLAFTLFALTHKDRPDKRSPRQIAAAKISSSTTLKGDGNTPKARELAEKYATMMQLTHSVSFASKKGRTSSSRYSVYCELHDGTCAFLACVPDYRKFDDVAKGTLESLAWSTARNVLKEDGTVAPDTELCVALKGMLMFGSVMTGDAKGSSPQTTGKDENDMDHFFPESVGKTLEAANLPDKKSSEVEKE
ncbi:MAG: DUF4190 domain-containing protein [Luteolibacter sp.]